MSLGVTYSRLALLTNGDRAEEELLLIGLEDLPLIDPIVFESRVLGNR